VAQAAAMANLAGPLLPADADARPRTWRDNYTDQELKNWHRLITLLVLGLPVFAAWYFLVASAAKALSAQPTACQDVEYAEAPLFALVTQGVLAVVGVVTFGLTQWQLPPNEGQDIYHAQKFIGGWTFLTWHCLMLQSVHLLVTFIASVGHFAVLACMTNSAALLIGALGFFVTIQYFSLVHDNPEFVGICNEKLQQDPPEDLRKKNFWLHLFSLPLAVVDITVSRSHEALHKESSLRVSLGFAAFYSLYYLVLIVCNFRCTGYWPYDFLKELKTLAAWVKFYLMQAFIICVFCLIVWVLTRLPSTW